MARFSLLTILLFSLCICGIFAQTYPDERVDSLLKTGIRFIINQDYKAAESQFNLLNDDYPDLPLGRIYLAANKIAEAYDYALDFDESYILTNLEMAKDHSEKLINLDKTNIWNRYCLALSLGYISYFDAINGNWFSALTTGINSVSEFEKILTKDENFFEAYIAIGTFEFWKSRKLDFMNWLPFANDTKNIGIEKLKIAIDSSSYNSHLAINSLIWIYIDQKEYEEAVRIAKEALEEFPQSRTFKWGLARAYEDINTIEAIKLYKEILNSYPGMGKMNFKNEIVLKHLIAQQYAKIGNKEQAIRYCDEILSMKDIPMKTLNEMSERMKRVNELKKQLGK